MQGYIRDGYHHIIKRYKESRSETIEIFSVIPILPFVKRSKFFKQVVRLKKEIKYRIIFKKIFKCIEQ